MSNCTRLRECRKADKLSQQALGEKIGLSDLTIYKLEKDETAWLTMKDSTADKIYGYFESRISDKKKDIKHEVIEEKPVVEEVIEKPMPVAVYKVETKNGLSEEDEKIMTLIDFAYEGLIDAKTHEEFKANLNMLKRIVNK